MAQTPVLHESDVGVIDYTPGSDVIAGQVILIGTVPMVAGQAIPSGVKGSLTYDGVKKVPQAVEAITAGDAVYWDENGTPVTGDALSGAATATAGGNNLMGLAAYTTVNTDTYVFVILTAAKRTATIAGSVTADDITGSDSTLAIAGLAAAQGGLVSVTGGTSSTAGNVGGVASLVGGVGGATADGGAAVITGGLTAVGATGTGGAVTITGGANANTTNGAGGAITIAGGLGKGTGAGGAGTITGGGSGSGATGAGGAFAIAGGAANSTNGAGGAVSATGGAGVGTEDGGDGSLIGGGGGATGDGGAIAVTGGATVAGATGTGGAVTVTGGANANTTNGAGGGVTITGGAGKGTGVGGEVAIAGGAAAGSVDGGAVVVTTGTSGSGVAGNIHLRAQVLGQQDSTPETAADTAALTDAQMLAGILVGTPTAAAAYTVRTGTQIESALGGTLADGDSFDLTVINLGGAGDIITMTGAAGCTFVGSEEIDDEGADVTPSGTFRFVRGAANTFVAYRIG